MVYQIKVSIEGIKPQVWRRVQVPESITLGDLHIVLQVIMGWWEEHLHSFEIDGREYGPELEDGCGGLDEGPVNEAVVRLSKVVQREKAKFLYRYDFGDNWEHKIVVEKILPEENGKRYPVCLGGERAAPLEDCGGVGGYYNLLDAMKNPKHSEREDLLDWAGDYDPEAFDLEKINKQLAPLELKG